MKTQNTKLNFLKREILELNNTSLKEVKGGGITTSCYFRIK